MATDEPSFVFGLEWWVVVYALWLIGLVLIAVAAVTVRHSRSRVIVWVASAVGLAVLVWSFFSFGQLPRVRGRHGEWLDCAYAMSAGVHQLGWAPGSCDQAAVLHLLLTVGGPALVVATFSAVLAHRLLIRWQERHASTQRRLRTG